MLGFGIDLGPGQHDDRGKPHPHQEADDRAQRAIGRVIAAEVRHIPRQQQGADNPDAGGNGAAPRDPSPLRPLAAGPKAVETGEGEQDGDKQERPAQQAQQEAVEPSGKPRTLSATGTTTMPPIASSTSTMPPSVKASERSVSWMKLLFSRSL